MAIPKIGAEYNYVLNYVDTENDTPYELDDDGVLFYNDGSGATVDAIIADLKMHLAMYEKLKFALSAGELNKSVSVNNVQVIGEQQEEELDPTGTTTA